jgi:hypothetical protein
MRASESDAIDTIKFIVSADRLAKPIASDSFRSGKVAFFDA